ncbi:MAG TPA: putative Ig domain-containing protein [Candidatus Acidoferrum sp.]|nr:putative Ig domain-containing protein [Candidatus Acidoferrum sp.]
MPPARAGVAYEFTLHTEGGTPPVHWRLLEGALPPGINLMSTGEVRGTPSAPRQQAYEFVVEVVDSGTPAQRDMRHMSLQVAPAPLHIVMSAPSLKIVPPAAPAEEPKITSPAMTQTPVLKKISYTPNRPPHWVVPLRSIGTVAPEQTSEAGKSSNSSRSVKRTEPMNPATFIEVYEDTKTGNRLPRYEPNPKAPGTGLQFTADLESSIVVVPNGNLMGDDPALNKLYMTAKLSSGDTSKDLPIVGYAEIGKDKASMATQAGAAFQSAANVQAMIFNMAYTVGDIMKYVYYRPTESEDSRTSQAGINVDTWLQLNKEIDPHGKAVIEIDKDIEDAIRNKRWDCDNLLRAHERFRLYQPEIQAISDFFVQKENLAIVEKVGIEVFWIDRDSMERIAQQFKDNLQTAMDPNSTQEAQAIAVHDLLERVKLVYQDFGDFRKQARETIAESPKTETHSKAEWDDIFEQQIVTLAAKRRKAAFDQLKKLLATGSISLATNQVKDGDRLTLTVESVPADGSGGGIPVVFEISIKKFGAKIQWSPSLLFVRRLGVTDAEASPPAGSTTAPLNRINFAPSPGMTFGIAYFRRGDTNWKKFTRALGPGLGMNVTFMNYNDPSFDLTTTQFTNTTGTNVQVGAGIIGSLFDNKLQVSYGWNLNVERRRTYFAVGFGFIEIGKEVAKYIPK